MADKKPTVAALQRKIERLEAQIEALTHDNEKSTLTRKEYLYRMVEAEARVAQAVRLLQGEDV